MLYAIYKVAINRAAAAKKTAHRSLSLSVLSVLTCGAVDSLAADVGSSLNAARIKCEEFHCLPIPPLLIGEARADGKLHYSLTMQRGSTEFFEGETLTKTSGYNGSYLGPTIVFNAGDEVVMHVTNELGVPTTTHWHGLHLPAVMDGGPGQVIEAGTTWNPTFTIMNKASTYWYHPHFKGKTGEQVYSGLAGFIIVKDEESNQLGLPGRYGVDDIPLVLQDKLFDEKNQIPHDAGRTGMKGDTLLVNGAVTPTFKAPAQLVRFRILNGSNARFYNIGFSDNREFYQIGSDGGLLEKPVALTRQRLSSGERIEILVDFSDGKDVDLVSYSAELMPTLQFAMMTDNPDKSNFKMMSIEVGNATSNAVTSVPNKLVTIERLLESDVIRSRSFDMTVDITLPRGHNMLINGKEMDMNVINEVVRLGDTEIWEVSGTSMPDSHPFHIHDVQFEILGRYETANPSITFPPKPGETGLKDTVIVTKRQTVRLLIKFEDFADPDTAYMYHCHILFHEDAGMMGQFVVIDPNL